MTPPSDYAVRLSPMMCACWVHTKFKFLLRTISKRLSWTPPRIQLWVSMICPILLLGKILRRIRGSRRTRRRTTRKRKKKN
jgi:hypothetical protein